MSINLLDYAAELARRAVKDIAQAEKHGEQLCAACGTRPAMRAELYGLCAMCALCEETRDERCAVCETELVKDGYLPTCGSMACRERYEEESRR